MIEYKKLLDDMCFDCKDYPCKCLKATDDKDHCYHYNKLKELIDKSTWNDLRENKNNLPDIVNDPNNVLSTELKEIQLSNGMIATGFYTVSYLGTKHWETYGNGTNHRRLSTKVVRWRNIDLL